MLRLSLGALSAVALIMLLEGPLSNLVVMEPLFVYGYVPVAGFSDRRQVGPAACQIGDPVP